MNKQEANLIVYAIESGLRVGGADSEHDDVANTFRLLRTVLFDCFKSEYKPGTDILLEYINLPVKSSKKLIAAVEVLGEHRKTEILKCAQRLLSLEAVRI